MSNFDRPENKEKYKQTLSQQLEDYKIEGENKWKNISECCKKAAKEVLGYCDKERKIQDVTIKKLSKEKNDLKKKISSATNKYQRRNL